MSIPMELKLKTTTAGMRLVRNLVIELQKLRGSATTIKRKTLVSEMVNPLVEVKAETAEIKVTLIPKDAKTIQLMVRGLAINYDVDKKELEIDHVRAHVPLMDGELDLQVFIDRSGVEVFACKGEVFIPINYNMTATNFTYELQVKGGEADMKNFEWYKLKSIW
jgi:sucrose-6-phosphate hydrolase SacC (GH32 family)